MSEQVPYPYLTDVASYKILFPRLYDLAMAIQKQEGYFPGTRSWVNFNPGNLRSSPYQSGERDGFAFFSDYLTGLHALLWDLYMKCSGRGNLPYPATIRALINVWAPPTENSTDLYVKFVASQLKVSPEFPVRELLWPTTT